MNSQVQVKCYWISPSLFRRDDVGCKVLTLYSASIFVWCLCLVGNFLVILGQLAMLKYQHRIILMLKHEHDQRSNILLNHSISHSQNRNRYYN